jgi:transposase-like protein
MAKLLKIKQRRIHQMTIGEWEAAFPTEDACAAYLVAHRWPSGTIRCPRCGAEANNPVGGRPFKWACYGCNPNGYQFSHIAGTIFENTNKPLRDWFRVLHMMLTSKKGVSALQVYRTLGFGSYKTAWYMCMRLRGGLANEEFRKLVGIVEIDETYVGGKAKNRHGGGDGHGEGGRSTKRKTAVIGAVERKGNVVARVIQRVNNQTVHHFLRETVSNKVSLVAHDMFHSYNSIPNVSHGAVNHDAGVYVLGAIHTNTIEGFWSLMKRGIVGSYHKVSRKYLPLYVAEFQFRYNNRHNEDIFSEAMSGC